MTYDEQRRPRTLCRATLLRMIISLLHNMKLTEREKEIGQGGIRKSKSKMENKREGEIER